MSDRFGFFVNTFVGIGLGLTFGYEHKLFMCSITFLCFNFYFEAYLGKN